MESQEKFYKIYELKKIKNVSKYYFIGAFKHEYIARDFRLNTIDLDLLFNKNIVTISFHNFFQRKSAQTASDRAGSVPSEKILQATRAQTSRRSP